MAQTGGSASLTNDPESWEAGYDSRQQNQQGTGFSQVKTTVADKIRSAADSLHQQSERLSGRNDNVSGYGHQAADWLSRSADYVEDFDPQRARQDIENQVRRNPGRSLLIAGAAGLILGALLRRR